MTEWDDHQLLAEFAQTGSEEAFGTVVGRYANLVYSAALRFTRNADDAEEITQAVFIILARKAGGLKPGVVLSGWLYQAARLTAANFVKQEIRRQHREQEAYMQSILEEPDAEVWKQIAPLLDEAMGRLGETDRNAVVLRFFENKSAREVAATLKMSDSAAHKRVNRALEKLRRFFTKRGVSSTTANIAGVISTHSVQTAPAAVAKSAAAVAAVKGAAASGSTLTLVKGALKVMAWAKAKMAVVVGMGMIVAAGTTVVTVVKIRDHRLYGWQTAPFSATILDNLPPEVKILPTKTGGGNSLNTYGVNGNKKMIGWGYMPVAIVQIAYEFEHPTRIFSEVKLPAGKYDYIASMSSANQQRLQREVAKALGVTATIESVETNVLWLEVDHANAPNLRINANNPETGANVQINPDDWSLQNSPIANLADNLEEALGIPIVDHTGITNRLDLSLKWNGRFSQSEPGPENGYQTFLRETHPDSLKKALLDQLGLKLVPATEAVDVLVVKKAR